MDSLPIEIIECILLCVENPTDAAGVSRLFRAACRGAFCQVATDLYRADRHRARGAPHDAPQAGSTLHDNQDALREWLRWGARAADSADDIHRAVILNKKYDEFAAPTSLFVITLPRLIQLRRAAIVAGRHTEADQRKIDKVARCLMGVGAPERVLKLVDANFLPKLMFREDVQRVRYIRALISSGNAAQVDDKYVIPLCMMAIYAGVTMPDSLRQRAGELFLSIIYGELQELRDAITIHRCRVAYPQGLNAFAAHPSHSVELMNMPRFALPILDSPVTNLVCAAGNHWPSRSSTAMFGRVSPWDISYMAKLLLKERILRGCGDAKPTSLTMPFDTLIVGLAVYVHENRLTYSLNPAKNLTGEIPLIFAAPPGERL